MRAVRDLRFSRMQEELAWSRDVGNAYQDVLLAYALHTYLQNHDRSLIKIPIRAFEKLRGHGDKRNPSAERNTWRYSLRGLIAGFRSRRSRGRRASLCAIKELTKVIAAFRARNHVILPYESYLRGLATLFAPTDARRDATRQDENRDELTIRIQ